MEADTQQASDGSRSHSRVQYRRHRLAAMAARAGVASSSTTLSPRVAQGASNIRGEQRGKKRKYPCLSMPLFRSPLSRMLVSPRIQLPGIQLRSPLVGHRKSPYAERRMLHIDLNVEVEEENADPEERGLDSGIDQVHQENAQNCFDADDDVPVALEDEEIGVDPGQENIQPWFDPFFDSDVDDVVPVPQENTRKNVMPDNDKRRAMFDSMHVKARKGYLKGHESKEVSAQFSVPVRTVQRIWKKGKSCLDQGIPVDVESGRSRCGRKKMVVDVSRLEDSSILSRTTIQDVATQLGVSKSKVYIMKKEGAIKRVSSSFDPHLTDQDKIDRLRWCLEMLDPRTVPHNPVFKPLFDYIFIDEKWFNITRKTVRYYAAPIAARCIRTVQNKNFGCVWLQATLCHSLPRLRLGKFDNCLVVATVVARFPSNKLGPTCQWLKKVWQDSLRLSKLWLTI